MSIRQEYVDKLKTQLDELNGELDKFEAKIVEMTGPARERGAAELDKARQRYAATMEKLDALRRSGADGFDNARAEVESVWKALKQSVNYFKSQI